MKSVLDAFVCTMCRQESTEKVVPRQSLCNGCQQDFYEVNFFSNKILELYFLKRINGYS